MDHMADISKYTNQVDEAALAGMERTYRLVLSRPDTQLVAWTDPDELATVKKNFLVKKLGLSESDGLDGGIDAVGAKLNGVNRKSRLTVYYLLAEYFGKLDTFK
ncbi:MAG TPA: DUF2853 family protein [Propionibacterium sp.]|nr:DUF2853 family protein [Propionibacterium sp.]